MGSPARPPFGDALAGLLRMYLGRICRSSRSAAEVTNTKKVPANAYPAACSRFVIYTRSELVEQTTPWGTS